MDSQPSGITKDYRIVVLVALYKSGKFIESKIQSIKQQTILNDALIVFLNCQNHDNELAACETFAAERSNIVNIVFNEHIQLYPSWNIGIQRTKSQYMTNYNADDQWHPTYLERCCNYLDQNGSVGIVSTGVLITHIPNQVWPNWTSHDKMPAYAYPLSTAGPCPVWRRTLHDKYGYFGNYRVIGDARMWEKFHAGGEKFGLIKDDLALYYASKDSLERRHDPVTGQSFRDIDLATPQP